MKKTYQITFKAKLSEDDVRAMKKCFFDAMNESMDIYTLWDLELAEVKDTPKVFTHISDVEEALMACKTIDEVNELLDNIPRKFGEWWVDTVPGDGGYYHYEVTNAWWDSMNEEVCETTYELEIEVEDEE